jgi:hypothetical protein
MTDTQEQTWVDEKAYDKAFCRYHNKYITWNFVAEYEKHRNPWRADFENMPKDGSEFVAILKKNVGSRVVSLKYETESLFFYEADTNIPPYPRDILAFMIVPIPEWKGK